MRDQVQDQVYHEICDQAWNQVSSKIVDQVSNQIIIQVQDQAWNQTRGPIFNQVLENLENA
jgi:hypothetical protein